jgi:leader peptidase (prepilin peptidase)/N-methyltransferase
MDLLATEPALLIGATTVLGLLVGSFLNVVIFRLPKMLERQWLGQCREYLATAGELSDDTPPDHAGTAEQPFDLIRPASHCPKCGRGVKAWENIPIISYLFLRGRCAGCGTRIPLRYPLVEAITGVMSAVVVWHFGFTYAAAGALLLTWALIALTFIDFDHQLLPDNITLPFVWLGLAFNLFAVYTSLGAAVIGAMAGYLVLWSVYVVFKFLTGKEGMGYGDFKLLAVLGAWLGWQVLPVIIILSSVVGAVVGVVLVLLRRHGRDVPIPFGPYLAAAGWIALLWGEQITSGYLRWAALG